MLRVTDNLEEGVGAYLVRITISEQMRGRVAGLSIRLMVGNPIQRVGRRRSEIRTPKW